MNMRERNTNFYTLKISKNYLQFCGGMPLLRSFSRRILYFSFFNSVNTYLFTYQIIYVFHDNKNMK